MECISLLWREQSVLLSGKYRLQLTEALMGTLEVRRERCEDNGSQSGEEHRGNAGGGGGGVGRLSSSQTGHFRQEERHHYLTSLACCN